MTPEEIDKLVKDIRSIPKKFQKYRIEKTPQEKHSLALSTMILHPEIIGINESVEVKREYSLFDQNGNPVMSPDLIFIGKNISTFVEYKSVDAKPFREKARKQLESGLQYAPFRFIRDTTKLLYVYEDFQVLELFDGNWRIPSTSL